ncbi:hypothetical protein DPMN_024958, partial [Dreissena polymorpha]
KLRLEFHSYLQRRRTQTCHGFASLGQYPYHLTLLEIPKEPLSYLQNPNNGPDVAKPGPDGTGFDPLCDWDYFWLFLAGLYLRPT